MLELQSIQGHEKTDWISYPSNPLTTQDCSDLYRGGCIRLIEEFVVCNENIHLNQLHCRFSTSDFGSITLNENIKMCPDPQATDYTHKGFLSRLRIWVDQLT